MTRGEKVCAFIERYCRVPEGKLIGHPIKLLPFQKKFILDVYDNPHGTKRGILSIARKNGKTALIACLVLAHLVGPEARRNSQIASGARSRDQAAIVFDLAVKIIRLNPKLESIIKIVPSKKQLFGLPMGVEFKALAAEGKTAHGLSPVLIILDELGQVKGPQDDFVDAMVTSQGAHENPLQLVISTQAPTDADLLSLWIDDCLAGNDDRQVCHLYCADADADLLDRSAWYDANPALGVFNSLENIEDAANTAKRLKSAENTFRNLHLNQRIDASAPFISKSVWQECGFEPDIAVFDEYPVFVGLDLSARNDLTALVLASRDGHGVIHVLANFFAPKIGVDERAKRDRVPYRQWAEMGYLTLTDGATVDYSEVAAQLESLADRFDIQAVAFDRWRIDVLKRECERIDLELPFVSFGQGYRDMAPALDTLEAELMSGNIRHGENPVLNMCAVNAIAVSDPAGNRKLDKSKSTARIDGMVALAMAVQQLSTAPEVGTLDGFLGC
ncbi:MAG: terminase large subunit [Chloroflexi bacterium]|nr:MAG: terminase large subunit [Chloroflexota bacterium]